MCVSAVSKRPTCLGRQLEKKEETAKKANGSLSIKIEGAVHPIQTNVRFVFRHGMSRGPRAGCDSLAATVQFQQSDEFYMKLPYQAAKQQHFLEEYSSRTGAKETCERASAGQPFQ